jgi:hypothetical protein
VNIPIVTFQPHHGVPILGLGVEVLAIHGELVELGLVALFPSIVLDIP